MGDEELLRNLERDDRYSVIKVLADRDGHSTELVRDPFARILIRKRIPLELANERAWRTLAQLESPLLPQVYEIYQLPDCLTVVVSYVEGISLSELVGQTGPVSPLTAAGYLHDICPAVSLLHDHNVVHRDITPSNVVVSQGTAHLIDLGIARAYNEEADHDTVMLGTWGFAAPEQYGFAQTDARSDIYALGGLLGFLLIGLRPDDQGFEAALHNSAVVPQELQAIVMRARAFEPSARFQTVEEFDAALHTAIGTQRTSQAQRPELPGNVDAEPEEQKTRTRSRVRRRPVQAPVEPTTIPSESRTEVTSPVRRPGKASKVFSIIMWVLALIFIVASLHVGFDPQYRNRPLDVMFKPLAGIASTIYFLTIAWETHQFARLKGRYDIVPQKPHQLGRTLARRYLVITAIGFMALFAISAISSIVFSLLPQ